MEDPRISQQQVAQPLSGSEALPVVQASVNTGNLRTLRTNINALKDYLVKDFVNALYPAGAIMPYASDIVDGSMGNWLLCDGRSVSLSAYPRLYKSIGKTYGSVDDSSFNLPDLRGRVIMGYCDVLPSQSFNFSNWNYNESVTVGSTGGEYNHKITPSEIPIESVAAPVTTTETTLSPYEIHQDLSWSLNVDGGNYFTLRANIMSVGRHGSAQNGRNARINYKTYIPFTNTIINQGSFSAPGEEGTFTLPFNVLPTSNASINVSGRHIITIVSRPSAANKYETSILYDDHNQSGRGDYGGSMKLIQLPSTSIYTAQWSNNAYTNTMQPYMALNYIIKY